MNHQLDNLPKFRNNEINIWFVNFDISEDKITSLNSYLSKDEIIKASKFRFKKDKNCSIITRGTLRLLSSKYLNINAEDIKFKYGEYGKPYYDMETNLKFNVSHSGNMAVIGFVLNDEIGIDVEEMKAGFEVFDVASNYFSNLEIESLKKMSIKNHVKGFYRCWTRKEAFIKAKSQGLSFPLDSFSISIDSDKEAELLETVWDKNEKKLWQIIPFETEVNYKAAIAVKGKTNKIRLIKLNPYLIDLNL